MHLRLDWALVKMVFGRSSNSIGDWAELQWRLCEAATAIGQSLNGDWTKPEWQLAKRKFKQLLHSKLQLTLLCLTASNGNPRNANSLHYIDPSGQRNAYQQAIMEIGEVIQFYDSDRRFPAWGFGGRIPNASVSHCFNLNGSLSDCEVFGIDTNGGYCNMMLQKITYVSINQLSFFFRKKQ